MEKIHELLKCKYCQERLENPVVLPCGETICEEHIREEDEQIECKICCKKHEIPVSGLTRNKLVARLIEATQQSSHHKSHGVKVKAPKHGQETLNRVEKLLQDYQQFNSTRVVQIYDFFGKLTNQVDIIREENNHTLTDDVYSKISEYRNECNSRNADFDEPMEKNIKDLNDFVDNLSSPKLDEHQIRKIETKLHSTKYAEQLESMKSKLLLGKTVEFVIQNLDFNKILNKNLE